MHFLSRLLPQSFILLMVLLSSITISAQPPIQWQKAFGGGRDEHSRSIRQTKDGGYVVVGAAESSDGDVLINAGMIDYWIIKMDANGSKQWQKTLGGSLQEMAYSVEPTSDNGFIMAGYATSIDGMVTGNHGFTDFWVTKLDANGNLQWQKALGGSYHDNAHSVLQASDGGYIVAGGASSSDGDVTGSHGGFDGWVVKLDAQGNVAWTKCYGGSGIDDINAISPAHGGGYIMTGYTLSSDGDVTTNKGGGDLWVVKIDVEGTLQWQKTFGGSDFDGGEKVVATSDGGYLVQGNTRSANGDVAGNHGDYDVLLLKLDASGNLQWQKCYGGTGLDMGRGLVKMADGGYLVGAQATLPNGDVTAVKGERDFWLVKVNATGAIQWQKTYGGSGLDMLSEVVATSDGWFIASGSTNSQDGDVSGVHGLSFDYWVVKFGPDPRCSPGVTVAVSQNNICMGAPVTFTATVTNAGTNARYRWKKNNITESATGSTYIPPISLRRGDVIVFEYSCTTACGRDTTIISDPVVMEVIDDVVPVVTIAASETSICEGKLVTFSATGFYGNMVPSYHWLVNGIEVGTNSTNFSSSSLGNKAGVQCMMRISTPFCQGSTKDYSNIIEITVAAIGSPQISIKAGDTSICKGGAVTFTATANGGANAVYNWSINGTPVGNNSPVFTTGNLQDGDLVRCSLQADPAAQCLTGNTASSNTIKMAVREILQPSISITASSQHVCAGTNMMFTAIAENAGNAKQYQWQVNGINTGKSDSVLATSFLKHHDIVACSLMTIIGCNGSQPVVSNAIQVIIRDTPVISFMPSEVAIMLGGQASLNAAVAGNTASFEWAPANLLTNAQKINPLTVPLSANTTYKLTVQSADGCTTSKAIAVNVFTRLYLPTAFTPNNDGKNDVFRIPPGAAFTLHAFSIFDRWGNKVFSTTDITKGWDGTRHGKPLDTGAYTYMISGKNNEEEVRLKGVLMLVR